ncbi:hypothetical protein A2U01_0101666, partial [Trifolium medium]|nr:hypothetical protein [Trifolium medium]
KENTLYWSDDGAAKTLVGGHYEMLPSQATAPFNFVEASRFLKESEDDRYYLGEGDPLFG